MFCAYRHLNGFETTAIHRKTTMKSKPWPSRSFRASWRRVPVEFRFLAVWIIILFFSSLTYFYIITGKAVDVNGEAEDFPQPQLIKYWTVADLQPNCVLTLPKWDRVKVAASLGERCMAWAQWFKLAQLMSIVESVFAAEKIRFFLGGEALLGSVLSHNFLPFVNRHKIDLYIPDVDRTRAVTHLTYLQPDFIMRLLNETITLTYAGSKQTHGGRNILNLVIGFVHETNNSVKLPVEPSIKDMVEIEKVVIFPLKMRPFGKLWVPVPNNSEKFLDLLRLGDLDNSEVALRMLNNGCSVLKGAFPCMERNNGNERLLYGENVLHECFLPNKVHGATQQN